MAASIILNDIRLTVYNREEYSTLDGTENGDTLVPRSLKRFIHNLVDGKGKNHTVTNRKCTSIAHAIISASRPRSFVSPILLGIAVFTPGHKQVSEYSRIFPHIREYSGIIPHCNSGIFPILYSRIFLWKIVSGRDCTACMAHMN